MAPHTVAACELEDLLAGLNQSIANPAEGLFGPDSVNWKVNRESALFLGGARAAFLQLAHPWVAAAIAQHSSTLEHPIARFHRTFRVIFAMDFGSSEQAFAVARNLHQLHQQIYGSMPESAGRFASGTSYRANDLDALRWVYATLIDTAAVTYDLVLPPLSHDERERYYAESKKLAALFGLPVCELPANWSEFRRFFDGMLRSNTIVVSSTARDLAHRLHNGSGLPVRPPRWYRALTVDLLPQRLREEFQFTLGERDRRSSARALRWIRRIYPRLPAVLRFVGPYNEARARLAKRAPGPVVRLTNRMWVGRPRLVS